MPNVLIAPNRDETFVDESRKPERRPIRWIEEVTRYINENTSNNGSLEDRVDELEPQYIVIDATDSPYTAANNDYILCDMSLGNVNVTLPASGRLHVSRDGVPNTLTLIGTVNGTINPTIAFSGSCASMAYITGWRYV